MLLISHIFEQFFFRIFHFLYRWYVASFLSISHITISILENLDKSIALRVSAKHLFMSMYGDRSVTGYILGFIFRSIRIIVGLIVYFLIISISIIAYLAWAALPILIVAWGLSK